MQITFSDTTILDISNNNGSEDPSPEATRQAISLYQRLELKIAPIKLKTQIF